MTNEENIPKPIGKVMLIGGRGQGKTLNATLELIEENTKLKDEIDQLNTQIAESNKEGVSILHDMLELREENEKLKEEIKLLNETSLNEEYWKALELFQKECETNFELRKQIALLPNDLNRETVELVREKGKVE